MLYYCAVSSQGVVTFRHSEADVEQAYNNQLVQLRIMNIDSDEVHNTLYTLCTAAYILSCSKASKTSAALLSIVAL
jgi:hypothetical protein